MTWTPFNANCTVRVKLTREGRAALLKGHLDTWEGTDRKYDYTPPREDEDGWSEWQLWDLMSRLGSVMHLGCPEPFSMDIELQVKP